jgi:regulator of cell morphogenesis and NO signaling
VRRTPGGLMSELFEHTTIGDIVSADFRTAAIFEQFGIDFCCGGRRSIGEACRTAAVDPANVCSALEALPPAGEPCHDDLTHLPVPQLIDHIVLTHHQYLRLAVPTVASYLAKLVGVHGARHPELERVRESFDRLGRDLIQHMAKEELVLFPYVRDIATHGVDASWPSPFGTIENPIRMMEREHREAGDALRLIRELTGGFTPPDDGCATYRACFEELAHFERDLHRHLHLENNVLFPRAIEIERRSWRS